MRILWVKVGGLWPLNTGGRLRSFHILSELSRRHQVTLLTTHAPGEDWQALRAQLPRCERVVSVPHAAPKWHSPRFPFYLLRSWFSSLPVDLWKCRVPALRAEAARLIASQAVDLCIADFIFAVPNVVLNGPVPVVFFAHNVEYMIWKRLRDNAGSGWRRALLEIEWRKMRRCEADTCRRADLTIAVSPADLETLMANAGTNGGRAVPTGVDPDYFAPAESATMPYHLVFSGSMDWHPNEDAILYFIESILPAIRREVPQTSFSVVGRKP
ncbi:MAG: glycosyltransferase, partial [Sulfurifustis sp.]